MLYCATEIGQDFLVPQGHSIFFFIQMKGLYPYIPYCDIKHIYLIRTLL